MQVIFETWEVLGFAVLMIVSFIAYSYEYAQRKIAEYRIEQQKELINRLLKDYNANVEDED